MKVAMLIPTYGRPDKIKKIADNLYATVTPDQVSLYFIAEKDDKQVIESVSNEKRAKLIVNTHARSYAGAINCAVEQVTEPYIFTGADDLNFYPYWLEPLLKLAKQYKVVGTNDLHNKSVLAGRHSTHSLAEREYALKGCIDAPGLFHEGYRHNYCDTEFIATAKYRGVFTPCLESKVEHDHFIFNKAADDKTYQLGEATTSEDQKLYESRVHLFARLNWKARILRMFGINPFTKR